MRSKRQNRSAKFKMGVAVEAIREQKTTSQIASEYQVTPGQVSTWKKRLLSQGSEIFNNGTERSRNQQASQEAELYEQIGRLKMELEWLKKKADLFN